MCFMVVRGDSGDVVLSSMLEGFNCYHIQPPHALAVCPSYTELLPYQIDLRASLRALLWGWRHHMETHGEKSVVWLGDNSPSHIHTSTHSRIYSSTHVHHILQTIVSLPHPHLSSSPTTSGSGHS